MKFTGLYEFTEAGLEAFRQAFDGELEEEAIDLTNDAIARKITGTTAFTVSDWASADEMATAILGSIGSVNIKALLGRKGVWGWLSFVCRDVVYPEQKNGHRKLGEVWRWFPSEPEDYQKGQRHLIRMPVLLKSSFGDAAEHLLIGSPSVPGELREQLTSQQDMFHESFQRVARLLYLEPGKMKLRRGAGGKGAGSSRRLAQVRKQLDVTWDLFALSPDQLLEKLPKEFDRFRLKASESAPL
ncbi:hypothetical protein [Mycoplana rhizolycopersici]|uniref:Uncharacterized protein n=1 Tax=Mycoplana rhizolycopersici TaxID=2746702 RepID=A0ABX2QAH1_9HYPH|nr:MULTISPECIES: hypothetical protein [Rhizobium/Agrobacterium group]NVP54727.1 hypothetical protein [Rhizobium rhizolycopersici]TQN56762.1 hypothetical protein FLX27_29500 [Agrobacterium tumefaciens]